VEIHSRKPLSYRFYSTDSKLIECRRLVASAAQNEGVFLEAFMSRKTTLPPINRGTPFFKADDTQ
jgi:hypothetical protein